MSSIITFALAVGSVGLWTLRVALTARGSRILGSAVAATEAVVFVLAFSHVTGSLNAPVQIAIYGAGVGLGTFLGLSVDREIRSRVAQDDSRTVSIAPGSSSTSPSGLSRAYVTSCGER